MIHRFKLTKTLLSLSIAIMLSSLLQANASSSMQSNSSDQIQQLPVLLVEAEDTLSAGQISNTSQLGILGDKASLDIPFAVTSYTDKYIADQQAQTLAQALQGEPSVRNIFSANGLGEYFNIRGFYTQSHEMAWNGLFGLVPHNRIPMVFFERVDVLRGTSALLYGMSLGGAVGGVINVVPKRAQDEPLTRLTASYAAESNLAAHVDVGRRFGTQKQFGVRVNALKSHGETNLDEQTESRRLGSIALDYRGEKLRAAFDAYNIKEDYDGGMPLTVSFASSSLPKAADASINTNPDAYAVSKTTGLIANLEYDFLPQLAGYLTAGSKDQKSYGYMANNALGMNVQANGDYTAVSRLTVNETDVDAYEVGLKGRFSTGQIKHQWVLSANRIDQQQSAVAGNTTTWASNIYHPTAATSLGSLPSNIYKTSDITLSSIALADTLSFAEDRYQLILGLRQQQVETTNYLASGAVSGTPYDESALTPAVGIVIKPWGEAISLYANYIEGLSQGGTVSDSTADNYGEIFAPYKSKQYEIGAKWQLAQFRNSLSLYQISKPSMIKSSDSNRYSDEGEQRNRGVEWSVAGDILANVRLLGGVVYMDAEYSKMASGINEGNQVLGIPKWQTNMGLEWDIKALQGLTLSANSIYTDSVYADEANSKQLPSWMRFDLGARYNTLISNKKVVFRAGIDNLFDKNYWSGVWFGYATIGSARSYKLSMQIDF